MYLQAAFHLWEQALRSNKEKLSFKPSIKTNLLLVLFLFCAALPPASLFALYSLFPKDWATIFPIIGAGSTMTMLISASFFTKSYGSDCRKYALESMETREGALRIFAKDLSNYAFDKNPRYQRLLDETDTEIARLRRKQNAFDNRTSSFFFNGVLLAIISATLSLFVKLADKGSNEQMTIVCVLLLTLLIVGTLIYYLLRDVYRTFTMSQRMNLETLATFRQDLCLVTSGSVIFNSSIVMSN